MDQQHNQRAEPRLSALQIDRIHRTRITLLFRLGLALFALAALTRVALTIWNGDPAHANAGLLVRIFALGALYDVGAVAWLCLPMVLVLVFWPAGRRWTRALPYVARLIVFALCVTASFLVVAELVFWNEFAARFNFIAVDYLIYTREVVGNITQSYQVAPMLAGVGVAALLGTAWLWRRCGALAHDQPRWWRVRLPALAAYLMILAGLSWATDTSWKERLAGPAAQQLAGNGVWEFFHALRYNQIEYERFYSTIDRARAASVVAKALEPHAAGASAAPPSLTPQRHHISRRGARRDLNVVMVSVESFGAEFIGALGGQAGLTPNFERLAREGLFFTAAYATGTRTVRGLEALTLSVPPTPGHAVPMRPHNDHLFTVGGVFKSLGYDALYLYGGYSQFDNMKAFFGGNGYTVIDRTALASAEISSETIWGVADEDLFKLTLRELDARARDGKRFFAHVMTTSNHRPYTYPAGRVPIKSGTGREGAVQYTDWAIGQFIEQARVRPWFDDTVFVIVADHTSIARGHSDLPLERYHIPWLIYSPAHVAPATVSHPVSQIDVAPTLLGLLNIDYDSEFFGADALAPDAGPARLFLANYQTVGLVKRDVLIELRPRRSVRALRAADAQVLSPAQRDASGAEALIEEAIAFYQVASAAMRR